MQGPQMRGRTAPSRSHLWGNVATPSAALKPLIVELSVGGMAQRASEYRVETAGGQCVLSKRRGRERTDRRTQEDQAVRTRELSAEGGASLCIAPGYEPLRRWGNKTGVLGGWALCAEGRQGWWSLSTATRERYERCREVWRDLVRGGRPGPGPITTDGAGGLPKAVAARWPQSLRRRGGCHKRQNLQPQVPAQAWPEFKALVVARRDAPTSEAAKARREAIGSRSQREVPAAGRCLLDDAEASLNPLCVPQRPQPYVRTSTLAERALVEERRRTKVIPH